MNSELEKKLIADLKKTGFGSELRAIAELNKLGWKCTGGSSYLDKDENKTREIDIIAYRNQRHKLPTGETMWVAFYLVIEIKKSEAPWIVFRQELDEHGKEGCGWNNLIWSINLPNEGHFLYPAIANSSLMKLTGWAGSGIHQAFKDPDAPSRWYAAFTTTCKAAEHELEAQSYKVPKHLEVSEDFLNNPTRLNFVQPLVILDGPLFSAAIDDGGELILQEIRAAPFDFEFQTAAYKRRSYRVDLITADHLKEYSELAKRRQNDIHDGILKLAGLK
jgi:hypothetical protein